MEKFGSNSSNDNNDDDYDDSLSYELTSGFQGCAC
jgi:hypothetical protein